MLSITDPRILPTDEVFTVKDALNGETLHFAIGLLQRTIDEVVKEISWKPVSVAMTQEFYEHAMSNRGIEQVKLDRLDDPKLRDNPVLMAMEGTNWQSCHLIDGHHRYVRRWQRGFRVIKAYMIPEHVWREFTLALPTTDSFVDLCLNQKHGEPLKVLA
jgi:hypothetical protein